MTHDERKIYEYWKSVIEKYKKEPPNEENIIKFYEDAKKIVEKMEKNTE